MSSIFYIKTGCCLVAQVYKGFKPTKNGRTHDRFLYFGINFALFLQPGLPGFGFMV
jgi:hypothetical protein